MFIRANHLQLDKGSGIHQPICDSSDSGCGIGADATRFGEGQSGENPGSFMARTTLEMRWAGIRAWIAFISANSLRLRRYDSIPLSSFLWKRP